MADAGMSGSAQAILSGGLRRAAFIDRDGVINEERGYVYRVEDFVFLPGAVEGLQRLQAAGFTLVVVTNQAGIARGYYGEADFARLTDHMRAQLAARGVQVAAVYHCPHHPEAGIGVLRHDCDCRKPRPGMLRRAAAELGLDLATSVLVGDKLSDIQAGRAAGVRWALLVESGHAPDALARESADGVFPDLLAASDWLCCAASPT